MTASVVFTDIVASTEMLERLGGDATRQLRGLHDQMLGDAVAQHSGRVVKSLGDGIMAAFDAARDALSASVAIQQALADHNRRKPDEEVHVRIGVSSGDVVWNDEQKDYFGTTVVEAARLCAHAGPDEILATELVVLLSRDAGHHTEPLGELELKGLSEPVPTRRVLWADRAAGASPFPSGLAVARAGTGYVGRPQVRARLREAWRAAAGGGTRAVLISGEPGLGKTRTAAELAAEAHADGALVLHGWCEEGVGGAYQPFAQALEQHTRSARRPHLGRTPGELRRLLPELADRLPELPPPLASDARAEAYALVDAAASWLVDASSAHGLVLVLDDLHWADRPTLLLLGHLLRTAVADPAARLLVVATYRDSDIDRRHPLADLIGEAARLPGVERLPLQGLDVHEVLELTEASSGHGFGDSGIALAETLLAQTEGNPFFVEEVLSHLRETGVLRSTEGRWLVTDSEPMSVPVGVRDVVARRISRLAEETARLLSQAAVVGRDFDVPLLARLVAVDEDTVLDALEDAVAARLVEEHLADHFRFRHALVQESLYADLSATRRRRMHRRVAEALLELRPGDVVALAHHFELGGPDDGRMLRAVEYGMAAAWRAYHSRALADAEVRFRRVLDMLDDATDDPVYVDALTGLGICQRDRGSSDYRETLLRAAELAGDRERLVAAVLANRRSITSIVGEVDLPRVRQAERALAAVGTAGTPERARLLAYLATETVFTTDQQTRLAMVDEAEAIARAAGDDRLLCDVLVRTAFPSIAFDRVDTLARRGEEGIGLADRLGDLTLRVEARGMHAWSLLTGGHIQAALEVSEEAQVIAGDSAPPTLRWMTRYWLVAHVGAAGRFAEARALNDELLAEGEATGEPDRLNWWAAASTAVMLLTAGVGGMADIIGAYADAYPALPTWRAAHVQALAEGGRLVEARAVLAASPMSLARMVEDPYGLVGVASLAQAAWLLRDTGLAAQVAVAARPFEGQWAHLFIGIVGPVSWSLALTDLMAGREAVGLARLRAAIADATERNCPAVATRMRVDLAEALVRAGDPAAARVEVAAVLAVSEATGESALSELARQVLAVSDATDSAGSAVAS